MKKLVTATAVASALLLTNASADTKWYAGLELGMASNTIKAENSRGGNSDFDNDYKDLKFVVGKGTGDNWYTQLYLSKVTFDDGVCYIRSGNVDFCFDDEMMEIGVEVMKKFEVSNNLLPFIKFGLGVGSRDAEGLDESSISSVGLAIGAGLDFKVNESISLLGGIDFGYRKYQDIEYSWTSYTVETSETYQKLYIGANYRF
jgi:opacity protein-like surface antigen